MDARLLKIIKSGDVGSLHAWLEEDPFILDKAEAAPTSETPLHLAALAGKTELVKEIINQKPGFLRALNEDGCTTLHIASAKGNLDIVRVLLSQSSDLCTLKDKGSRTPLHYAAIKGRVEIIEELLSHYPKALEERTARGETALQLALMNNQVDAVKLLAGKTGDGDGNELIKAQDDNGNKVLRLAVASNQPQIPDLLKSRNGVDEGPIEILSGDQLEKETNAAPKASRTEKGKEKTKSAGDSMLSTVDAILVVASLIATVTYQAGLSPPQTIWNDKLKLGERCTIHQSFRSAKLCPAAAYYLFMIFNTTGFFASVFLMSSFAKHLSERPYVRFLLPIALLSMVVTYVTLSVTMAPNGISLLVIYAITLAILIYCILAIIWEKVLSSR